MSDQPAKKLDTHETAVVPMTTGHLMARRAVATLLWTVVFALVVTAAAVLRLRLPGHSVVLWLPVLFLGRSFCGYRGSAVAVSVGGGFLATVPRAVFDGRVVGFLLGAVVVEVVIMLAHEGPGFLLGMAMGIAANLGKIVPKVATILAVGATPHHTVKTLPFMLVSYMIFGAAAGLVAAALWKGRKKFTK